MEGYLCQRLRIQLHSNYSLIYSHFLSFSSKRAFLYEKCWISVLCCCSIKHHFISLVKFLSKSLYDKQLSSHSQRNLCQGCFMSVGKSFPLPPQTNSKVFPFLSISIITSFKFCPKWKLKFSFKFNNEFPFSPFHPKLFPCSYL